MARETKNRKKLTDAPDPRLGGSVTRTSLARFVRDLEPEIRRVARRRLPDPGKSVYDSEDVLSTVLRRIDRLMFEGRLELRSEPELRGLILRVAECASIDRARLTELSRMRLIEDGDFARGLLQSLDRCASDDDAAVMLYEMDCSLCVPKDRHLFWLRLRGASHRLIAKELGITEEACRQRWAQVRRELIERFRDRYFE